MNKRQMRSATAELIRIATEAYSDNPETLVKLFSHCGREIRQQLEQGTFMRAYAQFMRGTKPDD